MKRILSFGLVVCILVLLASNVLADAPIYNAQAVTTPEAIDTQENQPLIWPDNGLTWWQVRASEEAKNDLSDQELEYFAELCALIYELYGKNDEFYGSQQVAVYKMHLAFYDYLHDSSWKPLEKADLDTALAASPHDLYQWSTIFKMIQGSVLRGWEPLPEGA